MSTERKLPDGTYTDSLDEYVIAWEGLYLPFEKMGFSVIGFDPGLLLCDLATRAGSFNLPVYAAQRIINELKNG
jgi:hypothetical protein